MLETMSAIFSTLFSLTFILLGGHAAYRLIRYGSYSLQLGGQEVLYIGPPKDRPLLTEGEDASEEEEAEEEDDETDERTLEERLGDLDIPAIEALSAPVVDDIGGYFFDTSADEDDCPSCETDTLHPFGEIIAAASSDPAAPPSRALRNRYGSACDACGHLDVNGTFEPRGRFGPLIGDRVELELFEILKGFEAETEDAKAESDDQVLAERERELEGELNEIRIRRQRHALSNGSIDPFRGTAPADRSDDPSNKT